MSETPNVTELLNAAQAGRAGSMDQLLPVVYQELKLLATRQLALEKGVQTLQPTALVHEAYLRLVPSAGQAMEQMGNRRYFFAAAAEAMRRILVDQARRKLAARHGGGAKPAAMDMDQLPGPEYSQSELLSVHDALDQLAKHDMQKAELVKLRYFAGFTNDEAAEILGITSKSAEKQWVYARAWLKHQLE